MNQIRSTVVAMMTGILLVLAAACGDDTPERADTIATEPTATVAAAAPTPEPSPTEASGSNDEPAPEPTATVEPEPTPTPETEPTPEPAEVDISAYVLSLDDLPTGWTVWDNGDEDSGESDEESGAGFCGATPLSDEIESLGKADAQFMKSQFGPFLIQSVSLMDSRGDAELGMDFVREEFGCTEWEQLNDEGGAQVWTVSALSFPNVTDETFAARASSDAELFAINMDLVVTRVDRFIMVIIHFDLGAIDSEQTEALARTAVEKLRTY